MLTFFSFGPNFRFFFTNTLFSYSGKTQSNTFAIISKKQANVKSRDITNLLTMSALFWCTICNDLMREWLCWISVPRPLSHFQETFSSLLYRHCWTVWHHLKCIFEIQSEFCNKHEEFVSGCYNVATSQFVWELSVRKLRSAKSFISKNDILGQFFTCIAKSLIIHRLKTCF